MGSIRGMMAEDRGEPCIQGRYRVSESFCRARNRRGYTGNSGAGFKRKKRREDRAKTALSHSIRRLSRRQRRLKKGANGKWGRGK